MAKAACARKGFGTLHNLARLYWYTVEFGLIEKPEGLRIYGSGIASSSAESVYAVEDASPNRIHFDLERVMRTKYRIDDFQESYFVIGSFEELFQETYKDFAPLYRQSEDRDRLTSRERSCPASGCIIAARIATRPGRTGRPHEQAGRTSRIAAARAFGPRTRWPRSRMRSTSASTGSSSTCMWPKTAQSSCFTTRR